MLTLLHLRSGDKLKSRSLDFAAAALAQEYIAKAAKGDALV